jgi:hypothetical protein
MACGGCALRADSLERAHQAPCGGGNAACKPENGPCRWSRSWKPGSVVDLLSSNIYRCTESTMRSALFQVDLARLGSTFRTSSWSIALALTSSPSWCDLPASKHTNDCGLLACSHRLTLILPILLSSACWPFGSIIPHRLDPRTRHFPIPHVI